MNMQEKERASAPTLMEALADALERLATLEARVVDLETRNGISDKYYGEISGEYYGDGMKGEHNAK